MLPLLIASGFTDENYDLIEEEDVLENGGGQYPAVEWQATRLFQAPAAVYVKGASGTLSITFKNIHSSTVQGTFAINSLELDPSVGSNISLSPSVSGSTGSLSMAASGGTDTVIINFTAPGSVNCGAIYISYTLTLNDGAIYDQPRTTQGNLTENMYICLSTPIDLQVPAWTDLLAYSCDWARGKSTEADVAGDCTDGVHTFSPWEYEASNTHYLRRSISGYALSAALAPYPETMDCFDVSIILQIALQGHGIETDLKTLEINPSTPSDSFDTNLLCKMGLDPGNSGNYSSTWFTIHQYTRLGSVVYVASNAQFDSLTGGVYKAAPKGWGFPGFWQTYDGYLGYWGLTDSYKAQNTAAVGYFHGTCLPVEKVF
jgi:hypothetical protein